MTRLGAWAKKLLPPCSSASQLILIFGGTGVLPPCLRTVLSEYGVRYCHLRYLLYSFHPPFEPCTAECLTRRLTRKALINCSPCSDYSFLNHRHMLHLDPNMKTRQKHFIFDHDSAIFHAVDLTAAFDTRAVATFGSACSVVNPPPRCRNSLSIHAPQSSLFQLPYCMKSRISNAGELDRSSSDASPMLVCRVASTSGALVTKFVPASITVPLPSPSPSP